MKFGAEISLAMMEGESVRVRERRGERRVEKGRKRYILEH